LYATRPWTALVERKMRSRAMMILKITRQYAAQVTLAQDDNVIQAFTADQGRAENPFSAAAPIGSIEPYPLSLATLNHSIRKAADARQSEEDRNAHGRAQGDCPIRSRIDARGGQTTSSSSLPHADQTRRIVSDLSYAGDEGGIVCHIVPLDKKETLFISITHVRMPRTMPLAAAVVDYQKHRVKKLRKQGRN
jgi:hypothetical protein